MSMDSREALNRLSASEIVDGIRRRLFSAEEVLDSCLARIRERDGEVKAWVEIDADAARALARTLDGRTAGPLVGVPFAVKDVIDTADVPTRMGSSLYEKNTPRYDAGVVAQARMAGALMLGKTTTCEFAGTAPTPTGNPIDPQRSPGGSSSGSAAAVADYMVPFAFGTQTGGSVLRPAAFCGVVGFKSTFGFYSIAGMKPAAHSFDTVGIIARSAVDVALIHAALMNDRPSAARDGSPRIGLFRSHLQDTVGEDGIAAVEDAAKRLSAAGARIVDVTPPAGFETITGQRAVINAFERARGLAGEWQRDRSGMMPKTAAICERGFQVTGDAYIAARRAVERFRVDSSQMFEEVDLLLLPTAPGEAPPGKDDTGDPRLQELWTMLHMPSLTLPAGRGRHGMPLGVQLVGDRFTDAALLADAIWAERHLGA